MRYVRYSRTTCLWRCLSNTRNSRAAGLHWVRIRVSIHVYLLTKCVIIILSIETRCLTHAHPSLSPPVQVWADNHSVVLSSMRSSATSTISPSIALTSCSSTTFHLHNSTGKHFHFSSLADAEWNVENVPFHKLKTFRTKLPLGNFRCSVHVMYNAMVVHWHRQSLFNFHCSRVDSTRPSTSGPI